MNIEIKNIEKAINPFNQNEIAKELNDYIINHCKINQRTKLTINIIGTLTTKEQNILKIAIHDHYKKEFNYLNQIDKIDNYVRIIFLSLGIILILISEQLMSIFSELFLITGWVFIWEMLYDGLFNQIKRKRKANIYKKIATSEIIFLKDLK